MSNTRRQPDTTRKAILEAALHLFTERGYFATSMHDVRQVSGLSTGAIYHHFASKEMIARALYDELLQQMTELVQEVMENEVTACNRHRLLIERLFWLTENEPTMVRFIIEARHREFLPDAPPVCSSKPFVLMMQLVEQGMKNKEIRTLEVLAAGALLFGPALRMMQLSLSGVLPGPIHHYLEQIIKGSWQSIAE